MLDQMLVATARAEDRHYWFRGLRRNASQLLRDALAGRRIARILDCGAGTGRNLEWLGAFGDVIGLERSAVGIEFGRKLGRRLVRGTVDQLPFPDASMDLTTSFDVLYCLDDRTERAALAEMWRVLKPGGVFWSRLASTIGIADRIRPLDGRWSLLPDGSERYVVDEALLLDTTRRLGGQLLDPIKTTIVQGQRAMTTWVARKL